MELSHFIQTSQVENVCVYCPLSAPKTGTLCVSSHHLLLCPANEENTKQQQSDFWLLHCAVDTVEKSVLNMGMFNNRGDESGKRGMGTLTLRCKDLRVIHLDIPGMEETLDIARSIQALSSQDHIQLSYPFFFRPPGYTLGKGWPRDTTENFFQRLKAETDSWRLSEVNEGFKVCLSYPTKVIVPQCSSDDSLRKAANFRQGGRFPILSYFHRSNGTVLLRCAQPLFGPDHHYCKEDEALLKEVLVGQSSGFIIDTRSAKQAKQAQSAVGGTKKQSRYPNWKLLHRPLERGRDLQESLTRLVAACYEPSPGMGHWLSKLQACRWMSNVQEALRTAGLIAECIEREGACVLVQGERGTDNTLLMTSLAQLILSPECRTMDGFQDLIEREWLQAGHPFQLRCAGSGWSQGRSQQESPNFLLFLDCCWQLGRQFPRSLAFNEALLCILAHHAYSSEYGTFLCNNESERNLYEVQDRTISLWGFLNDPKQRCQLQNPMYDENLLVIWPSVAPQSLQLWGGFFLRHLFSQEDTQLARNRMVKLIDEVESH
ncbi:myotubularin-related protein 9-like [Spea bombifrons]|uniref:myotubularin-related protein 9-like n=1 Tax=Spea bombifrons TaxID=233779 RepID=UPI00234A2970|nr:myotubularin-related protein 9-like [Spea bombifrons]